MIFRNLDNNHDWKFGRGKNDFVSLNEAVKLNVKTRLLEWVNDCFFNMLAGIDYPARLDRNQRSNLEADIKRIIIETPDVIEIKKFQTSLINRRFKAEYELITTYSAQFNDMMEVSI